MQSLLEEERVAQLISGTKVKSLRVGSGRPLEARRIASRRTISGVPRQLLGLAGVVVALVAWQILSDTHVLNPLIASSPTDIVSSARMLIVNGILWPDVLSSAKLFAAGFGLAIAAGVVVGVLLGWYTVAHAVFDPWVSILTATPRIALIPVIVAWFGLGFTSQLVIVWTVAVFPIIINVTAGVASIDRDYLRVARCFLATNRDVMLTVALPGAVPALMSGIRQGLLFALTGVVVAEYFVGNTGVGGLIINAGQSVQTGVALVGALLFAVAALLLTAVLRLIEKRFEKWRH
jgi:NitT/TauT family transport system permease protein